MKMRAGTLPWVLAALFLIAGCRSNPAATQSLRPEVVMDATNPLRAEVAFEADPGAEPTIELIDEVGDGFRLTIPPTEATFHSVPLLGLDPDTTYTAEVTAGDEVATTSFTTESLPDDLPPIQVTSTPEVMTPGLTLFNVIPLGGGEDDGPVTDDGYLLAVDEEGDVVWYYRQAQSIQDARRTEDGDLLFINHETGVKRLDVDDGTVSEWSGTTALDDVPEDSNGRPYAGDGAIRVETDQMHHEVLELPNGNLMTLSREAAEVAGFPEPICDEESEFTGSYEVVTDTVVEFDPDDGAVVSEWSLFDLVDPLEALDIIRPSEFCSMYLEDLYPEMGARDWTHANAVVLDEGRNAVLVSVRHLDQVFAIRYQDDENGPAGELLWKLGQGGDFTLESGEWFLHQHSPQVLDDGSIMIYDNGNERPGTSLDDPDRLPYSRAVQYEIDTENWTATQVWEHRADSPGEAVYAPFVGDADVLESGTVLIAHGGLLDPPAHTPQTEGVVGWGRVIEVARDSGDIVFDLQVKDPGREQGWIIYRAERIPSIYPNSYEVETIGG